MAETMLSVSNLIMPYFVTEGRGREEPIKSMPGIFRISVDNLLKDVKEARESGIKAILLFGVSGKKDLSGGEAYRKDGIVQKAVKAVKKSAKDIVVITDICLCGYTSHGHCGIVEGQVARVPPSPGGLRRTSKGQGHSIDNDKTLKILSKIALSPAEAGADLVAPSAMMDGQVRAIREALDKAGFSEVGILAYSAKYASNFYAPFREALDSAPQFGDRKSYQMDYRNSDEALREIREDIDEGADIVMVKPALSYLDVIYRAKEKFNVPLAAFNVSGEYAMVKVYCRDSGFGIRDTAADMGKKIVLEILTSIKRAGADLIITYHAKEVAEWMTT